MGVDIILGFSTEEIFTKLEELNDRIHKSILKHNIYYRTITLKIRFEGFLTYTRSKSLPIHIQDKNKVLILDLYKEFSASNKKVRLVGIKLSNLEKNSIKTQSNITNFISS